ncbi:fatty acyl-AMP ligase [Nocardia farcinica]|uniref:fatty acyl-AMP ligase n=1 Tax=Nocardia farcinica TaxID=37329 RepID=UPI0018963577|nr:fatty acyl-AMP ligase [Nocardia farcinica]MBF6270486.1 fatty acyl-AMP ligase [Nocardia farcinica]MCZ9325671.1 fatty acyl-AMP ligase [Nocardia farcinica]
MTTCAPTLPQILRHRATADPAGTAYVFLDDHGAETAVLTYAELERRTRLVAGRLARAAAPGDRALLVFPPGLDFIVAFFACLYTGVIGVPVIPPRPGRPHHATRGIVADCAPTVVLTVAEFAVAADLPSAVPLELLAVDESDPRTGGLEPLAVEPESIAFLQYTSGSTAAPKGVMVTHRNLIANQEMIRRAFGHDADSTFVAWAPHYHDQGLIGNILQPLYVGATAVLMAPVSFIRRPLLWLSAISRYRAHTSGGPNFAFDACVAHATRFGVPELDLRSWAVAFNGAEPIRADTLRRFTETFAPYGFDERAMYPCYGLAEATLFVSGSGKGRGPRWFEADAAEVGRGRMIAAQPGGPARTLTGSGRPAVGTELIIVDPATGRECPSARIGEIWVAGAQVAAGYWGNPEATAAVFGARVVGAADRTFLRTGDLGRLVDGELFVTGRCKDLIVVRGRNHYPHDLEHTAQAAHPAARAGGSAAFSVDAPDGGRVVIVQEIDRAYPWSPAAGTEIAAAIRAAVAAEHDLASLVVLTVAGALPKTSSGKIMRAAARAIHLGAGFDQWARTAAPPRN